MLNEFLASDFFEKEINKYLKLEIGVKCAYLRFLMYKCTYDLLSFLNDITSIRNRITIISNYRKESNY